MKKMISRILNRLGYKVEKITKKSSDSGAENRNEDNQGDAKIMNICSKYTMTSKERLLALLDAVEYVSRNGITGDFVECGVWKGGSSLAAALKFSELNDFREIYMFDTFEGMTSPTKCDVDYNGMNADTLLNMESKNEASTIWCVSDLDSVKETMKLAENYPKKQIKFIKGKVEDTIKSNMPSSISILRLDTDWYESTKYEMEYLFPKLVVGGVLIIDDYGHWLGAKKAIDEYLRENNIKMLLNRIDYTGRIGVKVAENISFGM